jgi:hypothetical protein
MAFVLSSVRKDYWWPMSIDVPKDGGGFRRETFKLLFRWLPQSEVEQIMGLEAELNHAMHTAKTERMKELLPVARQHAARIVLGWEGIFDRDPVPNEPPPEPYPFTAGNLSDFLEIPGMASAVCKTYTESFPQAKVKN